MDELERINAIASLKALKVDLAEHHANHPWVIQYKNPYVLIGRYGMLVSTFRDLNSLENFISLIRHDEETF
jgi:hypothetical protein